MSLIFPFRGVRPAPDYVEKVACPPYDVIDSNTAKEYVKTNPVSFLNIIKPEIHKSDSDENNYKTAQEYYINYKNKNILQQDKTACFYLYRQIMGTHKQTGIVTVSSVEAYLTGRIKKHEHTQPEKVNDRVNLMETLKAQTGPVFIAYKNNAETKAVLKKAEQLPPEYDFEQNGVRHIFTVISDQVLINEILNVFNQQKNMYIADGHHRSEAACKCYQKAGQHSNYNENYGRFLTVLFDSEELLILPYNRIVKDLNGLTTAEFLQKLEEHFIIRQSDETVCPKKAKTFGLYLDKSWYILEAGTKEALDVTILQNHVLSPLLGIHDPRNDKRISFAGGINSEQKLVELVDSGEYQAAFSLYPTQMHEVIEIADAGEVMPPKSTWFEPKLLSGLVTHELE